MHTAINGITSSSEWDKGEGWECAFQRQQLKPGWQWWNPMRPLDHGAALLEVTLPAQKMINRVVIYTLDSKNYPASRYGIRAASLQVMGDMTWLTVGRIENGIIIPTTHSTNEQKRSAGGKICFNFRPITTDKIRLVVYQSNDLKRPSGGIGSVTEHSVARVVEIEATGFEWMQPEQKLGSISKPETELDKLLKE
jgi:hypothetical protein